MKLRFMAYAALAMAVAAPQARADAGIPMVFIFWPMMIAALLPVVVIESAILSKRLSLSIKKTLWATFLANLGSTLIGVPLAWIALVIPEMMILSGPRPLAPDGRAPGTSWMYLLQAPWLYPDPPRWLIPSATLLLLIPFFFVSWHSETLIAAFRLKSLSYQSIRQAMLIANIVTYVLLALFVSVTWALGILQFSVS